jgi:glycosylphosphatidylinositol deacylase
MAVIGPLVIFSGIVFVVFVLGLYNFLISNEENGCEMTYMIEYPQFVVSFGNLCQLI